MKALVFGIFVLLIAAALFKPYYKPYQDFAEGPMSAQGFSGGDLISEAYLSDSIPAELLSSIGLKSVAGIKINHIGRPEVEYFSYTCPKDQLLKTLVRLPMPFTRSVADVTYRQLDFQELVALRSDLPSIELENSKEFWNATSTQFEAFECLKPPFKHTILLSKLDQTVLHRVEPYI